MYSGLLIKESVSDETVLDFISIVSVEVWRTDNTPKYWTAISFTSDLDGFQELLSKALKGSEKQGLVWYVDFQDETYKYIVLKDTVLKYRHGNTEEKNAVCRKCVELGVSEEQLDWSE